MTFILNAGVGTKLARDVAASIPRVLSREGFEGRILVAENGLQVANLARRAVQKGSQAVIAGGGDGTVNAVAAQLAGSSIPLGVLPLGTFNHFAKELGIPSDPKAAVRTLLAGRVRRIDVGEVNGRVFVNNSSLGIYPWMVAERVAEQEKGHGKWVAFAEAAAAVLRRYPFLDVRFSIEGRELQYGTPFVFIGNNRYSVEAFRIGKRESLSAGTLCLFVARRGSRSDLLKLALRALSGSLQNASELHALSASEIWVETRRKRLRVALDGEIVWMESPLRYRSRPGALRVIVPADRPGPA